MIDAFFMIVLPPRSVANFATLFDSSGSDGVDDL